MWFPRRSGKAIWTKSLFFISDAEGLWEERLLTAVSAGKTVFEKNIRQ